MPRIRRPLLALIALLLALAIGYGLKAAGSGGSSHQGSPPKTSALSSLPPQAAQTVALIEAGGPFPFPGNDGVVFHNNEHALPREPDGYYREYTVATPGSTDRGARRIIADRAGDFYYTPDHYASFARIDITR